MIIWRGRGFLVAVIAFGCLLIAELATRSYFHDDTYYEQHGWPKLAGFVSAAGIVWLLGPWRSSETAMGVESLPPPESILRDQDTLFFIPAKYWPLILCGLGIVIYFVR
jgi:hypothetical protein